MKSPNFLQSKNIDCKLLNVGMRHLSDIQPSEKLISLHQVNSEKAKKWGIVGLIMYALKFLMKIVFPVIK